MVDKSRSLLWGFGLLAIAVTIAGCGKGANSDQMFAENSDMNVKRLAWLYGVYQVNHNWNGPRDEYEFRKFIQSQSPNRLSKIGINADSLDDYFISERDNLPFKIRWEVIGSPRGPEKPVIFESNGVDGKFHVGFTGNKLVEVDQSEYDKLWSGETDEITVNTDQRQDVGQ